MKRTNVQTIAIQLLVSEGVFRNSDGVKREYEKRKERKPSDWLDFKNNSDQSWWFFSNDRSLYSLASTGLDEPGWLKEDNNCRICFLNE